LGEKERRLLLKASEQEKRRGPETKMKKGDEQTTGQLLGMIE